MEFISGNFKLKTNLGEEFFKHKLDSSEWVIGMIDDNPGINDENNNNFYMDIIVEEESTRVFKDWVSVKLFDKTTRCGHLEHWYPSGKGWFAISFDEKWAKTKSDVQKVQK
tara:strand:- start:374 stop:706 length:333 start_codon:yes stop_codon:yes gene_type:complete